MSNTLSPLMVITSQPDGCHLHDHCLSCPLPVCYFDRPAPVKEREAEARRLVAEGKSHREAARIMGIGRSSVTRLVAGA